MSDVLFEMQGQVAVVRLNRPDRLNAVSPDMLDLLRETLDRAVAEGARAVLMTGEGRAFCSGADLTGRSSGAALLEPGDNLRGHYNPLIETFAALPIPVVTAVNGAAAGAGASLALIGDIVVMARSSYLLLAFANIGLVPDAGVTWLIGKSAGRAKVLEMALLGERMSAEDARDAGMVSRVVDDEALMDEAMAVAQKLASMPTKALGMIRKQVAAALTGTLSSTLAVEADHQTAAAKTKDFQEGVAAFLLKRKAEFTGQ